MPSPKTDNGDSQGSAQAIVVSLSPGIALLNHENMMRLSFLLVAFIVPSVCITVVAGGEDPFFSVKREISVEPLVNGQFVMNVDLGDLPCGRVVSSELVLKNNNAMEFDISQIKVGCNCIKAKLSSDKISPFSKAKLAVRLETPKTSSKSEHAVRINLLSDANPQHNLVLLVRYQTPGLLCFRDRLSVHEVNMKDDKQDVRILLVLGSDIKSKDLEFTMDPPAIGHVVKFVETADGTFASVTLDSNELSKHGNNIRLTVEDRSSGISDSSIITLLPVREIEINPSNLRFTGKDDSTLSATAVLRIRPSKEYPADSEVPVPRVTASIAGRSILVEKRKLSSSVYRLTLKANGQLRKVMSDLDKPTVHWQVSAGELRHTQESQFSIENNPRYKTKGEQ